MSRAALVRASALPPRRPAPEGEPEPPTWRDGLTFGTRKTKNANGGTDTHQVLDPTAGNLELYLTHDPLWADCLAFDEMQMRPVWQHSPPVRHGFTAPTAGTLAAEADWVLPQTWFRGTLNAMFSQRTCETAMGRAAERHRVHAVRQYLETLPPWDGIPRLDTWLMSYFGTIQTTYTARVGRAWLISAVARPMRPGVKVDTMLILEGGQGVGKGKALRALMPNDAFFDDSLPDLRDKDAMIHLRSLWLLELAELDALRNADNTRVKAFLSKQYDRFRPPFGRVEITAPRGNVFIGTTNSTNYLHDVTGARRFWPVTVGERIDVDGIARDRDQLWAEALAAFRAGEPWHLDDVGESEARVEQSARFAADAWEEPLSHLLAEKQWPDVTAGEALVMLGVEVKQMKGPEATRIGKVLKRLEYDRRQRVDEMAPIGPNGRRPLRWVYVHRPHA